MSLQALLDAALVRMKVAPRKCTARTLNASCDFNLSISSFMLFCICRCFASDSCFADLSLAISAAWFCEFCESRAQFYDAGEEDDHTFSMVFRKMVTSPSFAVLLFIASCNAV